MRIDARDPNCGVWFVYHAEWMEEVKYCVYVDSVTLEWAHHAYPVTVVGNEIQLCRHTAKRIDIHPASRLIIINPIPDADEQATTTETQHADHPTPATTATGHQLVACDAGETPSSRPRGCACGACSGGAGLRALVGAESRLRERGATVP